MTVRAALIGIVNGADFGTDLWAHLDAARSWLAGDGFYHDWQLADRYSTAPGAILYPPVALYLFVPFTVLPATLWWIVPLSITGYVLWRLRPSPAGWFAIALLAGLPHSREPVFWGNPVMWSMAALAAGLLWRWPAVLVVLKPSLVPFALVEVRHRSWWLALGLLAIACVPFGWMWRDWIVALLNGPPGLAYSLTHVPLMLIPLVAYVSRGARPAGGRLSPAAPR